MTSREKILLTLVILLVGVIAVLGTIFFLRGGNKSSADSPATATTQTNTDTTTTTTANTASASHLIKMKPGWNLITIPYLLSPSDGASVLSGLTTREAYYVEDGCTEDDYNDCSKKSLFSSGTLSPGKGFWVRSDRGQAYELPVQARDIDTTTSYTVSLEKGWNTIGNPFPKSISWNPLIKTTKGTTTFEKATNAKLLKVKKYNPIQQSYSAVSAGDTVSEGDGLLIETGGALDLVITP